MPFNIVRKDIVTMEVDAIVNPTTSSPSISKGVDEAINKAAGDKLFKERKQFGVIDVGSTIVTKAYYLKSQYVIHAVAPHWNEGIVMSSKQLKSYYISILERALLMNLNSIAIPLVDTDINDFPHDEAITIATDVISSFLQNHDLRIYLVVYGSHLNKDVSKQYQYIAEYIDEHYINLKRAHSRRLLDDASDLTEPFESLQSPVILKESNHSLEAYLSTLDEGFTNTLLSLIDSTGHEDAYIYKKANIDRKLFSKIRNNPDYKPSKATALAFAIALELNIDQTLDLLSRAGFTMSPSSRFDLIVEYHIKNSIFNIFTINEALFTFDQPLLG